MCHDLAAGGGRRRALLRMAGPAPGRICTMYPDHAMLMEVGRIAVAAGRLDAAFGAVWWHLAPDQVDELEAGTAQAGKVRAMVRALAIQRLDDFHADALRAFVAEVEAAQRERNEVMHSRWLLRGPDSMWPVSEFLSLDEPDRPEYLRQWERQATSSNNWTLQRNRSMELNQPFGMEQFVRIERRLAKAEEVAVRWHFKIASIRETGAPPGWRGPLEARRGPQPLPPGALAGNAAMEALNVFIDRYRESRGS